MNLEQEKRLDKIEFDFNLKVMTDEEDWNLQFKKLSDYYEKHGHCELLWAVDRFTFI
jgi:hypothetical protein